MPVPTIPLWGQIISNGLNNIRNIWKTSKERYNSMSPEQKAEAARVGNQWVTDNVLPVVTTVGELIPQTSIPMAAYNTSEAVKKGNYEEAFQHVLTPVLTGSVSKGVNLGLKAGEKAIDTAGKALKNADNYITIQNALRTGKLRFGEPTTYTGIHQSKTPLTKVQFPFQRWDVTTHGADPNGFWLTLADSPNTTGTMASRPYASRWSATSQKPLIQTGEVKGLLGKKNNTRNAIVKYGRKHGADAFEFRGIRDNAIPQTDVVMVTEGTNPQYLGGVGQVKYAGPTTGKSTFIKANSQSDFVDLDAIPGYKQLRKNVAEQLGLDWKSPKVTDSPEYQQAFNNFIREWAQNTENSGKTLFGSAKGLLRGDNPLTGQPFIPDFETFVARNQARGFKENPEQLRAWYNSIIDSYPEIKIDNRFIGEMPLPYKVPKTSVKSVQMEEPIMGRGPGRPKKSSTEAPISPEAWDEMLFEDLIGEQGAINAARKASQAGKRVLKPITEAEKLGIPKSLRSDPRALEDPYYWGYEQWNQRYNDAVKAGNIEEAQRLRDLHFQTKAINNQLQVDGHPIPLYHGNIGSDSQLASAGYNPYSTARTAVGSSGYFAVIDPQIASTYKGPKGSIRTVYGYSKNPAVYDAEGRSWQDAFIKEVDGYKFGIKTDAGVNSAFNSGHDAVLIDNVVDYGFYTPASHPRQPFTDYVFKPGNVKLKDAVVEDGLFFEPIPIVKRDNFRNPDIRYKQGGKIKSIVKAQKGVPEIDGGELNPAIIKPKPVTFILQTDPITKETPITHSSITVKPVSKDDLGFFISKGSDDATYNLFTANCSDATGQCLQDITGVDFTSGITTPIGVSRKSRSVFGNQSGYTESGGGLFKSRIQSFEVPWYDYRKAKDLYKERLLNSLIKKWRTDGIKWSKERENALRKNWWEQNQKLKYYLDENNNVIKNP